MWGSLLHFVCNPHSANIHINQGRSQDFSKGAGGHTVSNRLYLADCGVFAKIPLAAPLLISSSIYTGTQEPNKLTCSQLSGLIAQVVEHCTNIAEVVDWNPVEATWSFQVSMWDNCLNCSGKCEDHFFLSSEALTSLWLAFIVLVCSHPFKIVVRFLQVIISADFYLYHITAWRAVHTSFLLLRAKKNLIESNTPSPQHV